MDDTACENLEFRNFASRSRAIEFEKLTNKARNEMASQPNPRFFKFDFLKHAKTRLSYRRLLSTYN